LALLLDWTAIPFALPILWEGLRDKKHLLLPFLPTLAIYIVWLMAFRDSATGELLQRLPSYSDLLLLLPRTLWRLSIYGGPIPLIGLIGLLRWSNIDDRVRRGILLQVPFVLLWANFYTYHVPYLLNLLPFLSAVGANALASIPKKSLRYSLLTVHALYGVGLAFVGAYPYRLFGISEMACVIKRRPALILDEKALRSPSIKVLLTLLPYPPNESTSVVLSYSPMEGARKIPFGGDTLFLKGDVECESKDMLPIDRFILRLKRGRL